MHTLRNSFILKTAIIIPILWTIFAYYFITDRVAETTFKQYNNVTKNMKHELSTLINEKAEAILIIALAIKNNIEVLNTLERNSGESIDLQKFSLELREDTSLKNIWFQIVDAQGISVYRSWTKKRGDDLKGVRADVDKMLLDPKISSTISVGKFDLTFKSMVPLFKDNKFVGIVETIAKFNSISIKMAQKNYDIAILVDERYKNQLKMPFTNIFLDDNYIANLNVNEDLLQIIDKVSLDYFKNLDSFYVDETEENIYTTYILNDISSKPMAYIVMRHAIEENHLESIIRVRDRLILIFSLVLIGLIGAIFYIYIKKYKQFISDLNVELENTFAQKTHEIYQQSKELDYLAHHDPLTSLPNRLLFNDRLKQSIKQAKRNNQIITLLFLDLDRFKEVNDTYGHDIGDELLVTVTKRLKNIVREGDTISRLGGDEFTILLNDTDNEKIIFLVEKIIDIMKQEFSIKKYKIYTSFSIGISSFPDDGQTIDVLLRNADTAMYAAKESGKNTYRFYNEAMTQKALQSIGIKNDLINAIKYDQFKIFYQIKIDTRTNSICGLEALIRWEHPKKGLLTPDKFLKIAENNNMLVEIDTLVLNNALDKVVEWNLAGIKTGKVSVNCSTKTIESKNFISTLQEIVKKSDLHKELLEIEITENSIMNNPEKFIDILNAVKELGISIAIDDFGTGYSSLSYLKQFPVDILKIDKSFIDGIPNDENDMAITNLIISLATQLKLDVVAEGVETQEHVNFLAESNVYFVQGYFFSKPLPAQKFYDLLHKYQ